MLSAWIAPMRPAPNWQKRIMLASPPFSGPPSGRERQDRRESKKRDRDGGTMATIRLTMGEALVRFLAAQRTVIEGKELPLFAGVFAIFGHGNVAGLGEALARHCEALPTYRSHNEQAMA